MKSGYKQTVIGDIPVDWEAVELIEALELQRGYDLPVQSRTKGEYPLIGSNGTIDSHNEWKVAGPTIVTGRSGTIGKIYYEEENCWPLNTTLYVKNTKGNDPKYLFYLLLSVDLKQYGTGTGVPTLNRNVAHKHKVALPPLLEQRKIAKILSTVDEKLAVMDEQLAQTQELKKGLMQRLLTKGIGHTAFKESPLGEIPQSWKSVRLDSLCSVKGRIGFRGYTKADLVQQGQGALTIGAKHVNNISKLNFRDPEYISWEKYEESPEIKVAEGDILVVQRGSIGKIAFVDRLPEPATINPSMVLLKAIKCNNKFLFYFLCSELVQNVLSQITTSTAVPMISQAQVKGLQISIPSLSEQEQIIEILTTIDDKLQVLTGKKAQYQELKRGLMQQLLTGQRRVITYSRAE